MVPILFSNERGPLLCVGTTQGSSGIVPTPLGVTSDITSALSSIPSQGSVVMITDETAPDIMSEAEKLVASNVAANTTEIKAVKLLDVSPILTIWSYHQRKVCSTSTTNVANVV